MMNKVLLPVFLSHPSINTAKLNRRKKSVATIALRKISLRQLDGGFTIEANKNASSNNAALNESCPEGSSLSKRTVADKHESSAKPLRHDTCCQSVLLSERFENWMDFIESTSRVLVTDVTSDIICDSFLCRKLKPKSQHDALTPVSVPRNNASDVAVLNLSHVESAKQGALSFNECLGTPSATDGRPLKIMCRQPPRSSQRDVETSSTPVGEAVATISKYDAAVACFVGGIMSGDEAARIELELEAQMATKEDIIQDQLKMLYAFYHQPLREGAGRRKEDTVEDNVRVA